VAAACLSGARATAPTPRESRGWQHRGREAFASPPRVRGRGGAEEGPVALRRTEDHVWFEDRWMVASLCDE
jgi:hypothetical protein